MKKSILLIIILCIIITGCQKTPDKSSVVSKADGLDKDIILEPLKDGEKRITDIPQHWQMNEKKSNDRLIIKSDLNLEDIENVNLPIKEMKNDRMNQDELEELVSYFAKDETLYVPQINTKDVYQKNADRIKNKEGAYAKLSLSAYYKEIENAMRKAVEIAPEKPSEDRKIEVKFQDKIDDPALFAARRRTEEYESQQKYEKQIYFSADVGEARTGHIDAETYNPDVGNSSSFSWKLEGNIIDNEDIQSNIMMNDSTMVVGQDTTGYAEEFQNLLSQYESCLNEEPFDKSEGQKQSEQILKDLDIKDLKFASSEKVLWFPKDAMPERASVGTIADLFYQGDLEKVKAGYLYTYSHNIEGISAAQKNGVVSEKTANSYAPPFPVETITILVTEEGIKSFSWKSMAKEGSVVAENTKLVSFKTIQGQLVDQIFYWGTSKGQPASDPTVFTYNVISAQMGYTYIPAYEKPADAWLVPAWFFTVTESSGGADIQNLNFVINALDGGMIGKSN